MWLVMYIAHCVFFVNWHNMAFNIITQHGCTAGERVGLGGAGVASRAEESPDQPNQRSQ